MLAEVSITNQGKEEKFTDVAMISYLCKIKVDINSHYIKNKFQVVNDLTLKNEPVKQKRTPKNTNLEKLINMSV